jgi:hypothetical protein
MVIDALDEYISSKEALVTLLTETLFGPDLPSIHLLFTSRPGILPYSHASRYP